MSDSAFVDLSEPVAIHPAVVWVEVDGEIVAVQRENETVHLISDTGALLWKLLDGSVLVSELAEDVAVVFGVELERALADVSTFVEEMHDLSLVVVEAPETKRVD